MRDMLLLEGGGITSLLMGSPTGMIAPDAEDMSPVTTPAMDSIFDNNLQG